MECGDRHGRSALSNASPQRLLPWCWVCGVTLLLALPPVMALEPEEVEEPAGASFQFFFNSRDDIYGIAFGDGTWLVNTPVFGDFFISLFHSRLENASFAGIGMTLRLMPHWTAAPFMGGGGSYNQRLGSARSETVWTDDQAMTTVRTRSDSASLWGAHAEVGVRFWLTQRVGLIELMARYVWTSTDRDHWIAAISTGTGF